MLEGPDVLAVGLEEFKGEILRCHARLSKPAPEPVTFEGGGHVFINADSTDKELADALLKIFDDRKNFTAARPLFEGSAKDILDDLEANLMNCEAPGTALRPRAAGLGACSAAALQQARAVAGNAATGQDHPPRSAGVEA